MFQSGSLGKQFTSAGIMTLVEDGLIELDGSVTEYLPEAPETWQPITIRHLLTHSSGIPDYTSEGFDYQTNYSDEDLVRMASGLELEFRAGDRMELLEHRVRHAWRGDESPCRNALLGVPPGAQSSILRGCR